MFSESWINQKYMSAFFVRAFYLVNIIAKTFIITTNVVYVSVVIDNSK